MAAPGTLTMMIDAAWRVTLLLSAAWAVSSLPGRKPAALRHAVWAVALAAALAVPVLSGVVPSWQLAVLPAEPAGEPVAPSTAIERTVTPAPQPTRRDALPASAITMNASPASHAQVSVPSASPRSAADWLGLLWAAIAAAIVGRYFASVASVRWLTRDAEPVHDLR